LFYALITVSSMDETERPRDVLHVLAEISTDTQLNVAYDHIK